MLSINHHEPLFPTPSEGLLEGFPKPDSYLSAKITSLDEPNAMDKLRMQDDDTGSGSVYSGLTSLENETVTDEFDRALLQHARDAQRMQDVRNNGQAFRKARPNPRIALTLDNLERNEQGSRSPWLRAQRLRSGSVGSSNGSDPPVNVPKQWGTKGKQKNDWLRRIHAEEVEVRQEQQTEQQQQQDEDAIYPYRTAYTGDESPGGVDWDAAAADLPVQSVEDTPLSLKRRRHASAPALLKKQNDSIQEIREWEIEGDFTSASLLASTPAMPPRNRALDDIGNREVESMERQAVVTTNRLVHISEVNSNEAVKRQSGLRQSESHRQTETKLAETQRKTSHETRRVSQSRSLLSSNKENIPLPASMEDTSPPAGMYKSVETIGSVDHAVQAKALTHPRRPSNRRQDSMALLRRLARVSSSSPSPTSAKDSANDGEAEKLSIPKRPNSSSEPVEPLSAGNTNSDYVAQGSPWKAATRERQTSAQAPEVVQATDLDWQKLEAEESAPEPVSKPEPDPNNDKRPASPPIEQAALITPRVTGAWVETPGPGIDVRPLLRTTDSTIIRAFGSPSGIAVLGGDGQLGDPLDSQTADPPQEPLPEPQHPGSALAAVVEEARNRPRANSDEALGESTINSLEDMINPNIDPTFTLDLDQLRGELEDTSDQGRSLTQAGKERRLELLNIEAMDKQLKAARTSLKDTSRSLRRAERRVDTVKETVLPHSPPETTTNKAERCAQCGCSAHRSVFKSMWIEFRSLFYTWDRRSRLGIRFTWLGLLSLVFWAWFLTETTLCSYYCHPLYAESMVGYGVDENAPRYPFVIPTLLFRPFEVLWRPVLNLLAWCFGSLFDAGATEEEWVCVKGFGCGVQGVDGAGRTTMDVRHDWSHSASTVKAARAAWTTVAGQRGYWDGTGVGDRMDEDEYV
ncbi:hypothetical protein LTR28_009854 [Elasticomyces elasticus]|nr:hypothetical protein LTR28_009854 [Elasticomyces elasticus]